MKTSVALVMVLLAVTATSCSFEFSVGTPAANTNTNVQTSNTNANAAVAPVNTNSNDSAVAAAMEKEPVPTVKKADAVVVHQESTKTKVYRGTWFDVTYPADFTARPEEPTERDGTQLDEAFFTSPDKSVEFFVYSPQWGGTPQSYLDVAPNEEMVSEKETDTPNPNGNTKTQWVTVKAKDGSYYRSYLHIRNVMTDDTYVNHVFGIKYKDQKSYDKYKDAYTAFKGSLIQYAD